jgi:hypothetical protein
MTCVIFLYSMYALFDPITHSSILVEREVAHYLVILVIQLPDYVT